MRNNITVIVWALAILALGIGTIAMVAQMIIAAISGHDNMWFVVVYTLFSANGLLGWLMEFSPNTIVYKKKEVE